MKDKLIKSTLILLVGGCITKILGMIIKIVPENLLCYKLDPQRKLWIESPSLFVEFEQGNVHGEYIEFNDTFSIAETSDLSKGRML